MGYETQVPTTTPSAPTAAKAPGRRVFPTIGIGPAPSNMAHVVDEHIYIDDIVKAKTSIGK
ncbi:MAG: hypothetical protein U5P10_14430 [Spirochaetia bacterium]|nr:hypothetical protein [Spirochaetia bacterium]